MRDEVEEAKAVFFIVPLQTFKFVAMVTVVLAVGGGQ